MEPAVVVIILIICALLPVSLLNSHWGLEKGSFPCSTDPAQTQTPLARLESRHSPWNNSLSCVGAAAAAARAGEALGIGVVQGMA